MYKPRTIGQYKVMGFLRDQFHLDSCIVWPISRDGLLLEDQNHDQIAFASDEDGIYECEIPEPGTRTDVRMFHEYLRHKCPEPHQQTFDAKTQLWLTAPIGISYAQALGLGDELFRHYLTYPMMDKEDILRRIATGMVSMDDFRSMQLWYMDGHTKDTLLVIAGIDGIGQYADMVFHYRTPYAECHQFYLRED